MESRSNLSDLERLPKALLFMLFTYLEYKDLLSVKIQSKSLYKYVTNSFQYQIKKLHEDIKKITALIINQIQDYSGHTQNNAINNHLQLLLLVQQLLIQFETIIDQHRPKPLESKKAIEIRDNFFKSIETIINYFSSQNNLPDKDENFLKLLQWLKMEDSYTSFLDLRETLYKHSNILALSTIRTVFQPNDALDASFKLIEVLNKFIENKQSDNSLLENEKHIDSLLQHKRCFTPLFFTATQDGRGCNILLSGATIIISTFIYMLGTALRCYGRYTYTSPSFNSEIHYNSSPCRVPFIEKNFTIKGDLETVGWLYGDNIRRDIIKKVTSSKNTNMLLQDLSVGILFIPILINLFALLYVLIKKLGQKRNLISCNRQTVFGNNRINYIGKGKEEATEIEPLLQEEESVEKNHAGNEIRINLNQEEKNSDSDDEEEISLLGVEEEEEKHRCRIL